MTIKICLLPLVFGSLLVAQQVQKIGIIDVQKALAATQEGQQATRDLRTKVEPKQKEFNARQQEITQLEQQLSRQAVLSDEKKAEIARSVDEKKRRLDRDTQDADESLRGEQQAMLQKLGQRMMAVLTRYGKENKYTLIFETGNPSTPLMYAATGMDITAELVSLYDKTYANGASAAPPPAAPRP